MNLDLDISELIKLKEIKDGKDGSLFIAEGKKQIPFEIKRVYFIREFNRELSSRGFHAHKELEQVIFCINGSFKLMTDNGTEKKYFLLNDPNLGFYLRKRLWHTMSDFSEDCIILVFASDYFDEADYIRDYDIFLSFIDKKIDKDK